MRPALSTPRSSAGGPFSHFVGKEAVSRETVKLVIPVWPGLYHQWDQPVLQPQDGALSRTEMGYDTAAAAYFATRPIWFSGPCFH